MDCGLRKSNEHACRLVLIERRDEPGEIAAMVRMLCGTGTRFITGQSLPVKCAARLPWP